VGQSAEVLVDKYIKEIIRMHEVPVSIVSDKDTRFRSHFWESLQENLGTRLKFSTSYHPQTDEQSEQIIQILEDMLRAYMIEFKESWEDYLHLVEISIITAIRPVSRWLHLKRYMAENAGRRYVGMKLAKKDSWD